MIQAEPWWFPYVLASCTFTNVLVIACFVHAWMKPGEWLGDLLLRRKRP